MHLVNFPKVRIKKYDKGFVVESMQSEFFGKKWKHIISVSGIKEEPWYFKHEKTAFGECLKLFQWDLVYYTNKQ